MTRGTYALLVHVPYELALSVGELGTISFKPGYYTYVGSALGGLEARVGRHLREEKKVRWHIDHLLLHARAVDVVVAQAEERKECAVAGELAKGLPGIRGFGASDCKCESHLFYSPDLHVLLRQVLAAFKNSGLKPKKGVRYG
ncbi:MAG: GIY-YIG nuclease family protein [Candidatus Hodarchaeaceae archaeon]|nr:GIY-YIG nuclease family protein [Candidatus Hodarchaeaceae archaeon]